MKPCESAESLYSYNTSYKTIAFRTMWKKLFSYQKIFHNIWYKVQGFIFTWKKKYPIINREHTHANNIEEKLNMHIDLTGSNCMKETERVWHVSI